MSLGSKIADARRKQNITQEQLAELLGVTRQSVSRWESDAVYPETEKLVKIAELLRVNCDYLLKDSVDESGEPKSAGLVTRLLKETVGKRIRITTAESDDFELLSYECKIMDFDGAWANIEIYKGKKTENKLIPVSSISTITILKGRE